MPARGEKSPRAAIRQWLSHGSASKPRQQASDTQSTNLADRLGLHAPFRSFGNDGRDSALPPTPGAHLKKRRKRALSSSSELQPAEVDYPAKKGQYVSKHALLDGSNEAGKPSKTYERRSRHRTLEDKYRVKQHDGRAKKQEEEGRKDKEDKQKRRRKEKSGNTLMHNFTASNVAQDRLTMKPAAALGIFHKGRASSPVRRKGLPDLTFSEVAFLGSHNSKARASNKEPDTKRRRKKDKIAYTEAQISRYFQNPGTVDRNRERHPPREAGHQRPRSSSFPPVGLTEKPFLGFGSSGANPSPIKRSTSLASSWQRPSEHHASPRSPSYYTWSRSSMTSRSPVERRHNDPVTELPVRLDARQRSLSRGSSSSSTTNAMPCSRGGRRSTSMNHDDNGEPTENGLCPSPSAHANRTNAVPTGKPLQSSIEGLTEKWRGSSRAGMGMKEPEEITASPLGHLERSTSPAPSPQCRSEVQPHFDILVSLDKALESLLRTCRASLAKDSESNKASQPQTALHHPPPGRPPASVDDEADWKDDKTDPAPPVKGCKTSEKKDTRYDNKPQDLCNRGSMTAERPGIYRLLLNSQHDTDSWAVPRFQTTYMPVTRDRDIDNRTNQGPPAIQKDRTVPLRDYSTGAWSSYNNMYEHQVTYPSEHGGLFYDSAQHQRDRASETLLAFNSSNNPYPYPNAQQLHSKNHPQNLSRLAEHEFDVASVSKWDFEPQGLLFQDPSQPEIYYDGPLDDYELRRTDTLVSEAPTSYSSFATPRSTGVFHWDISSKRRSPHYQNSVDVGFCSSGYSQPALHVEQEHGNAAMTTGGHDLSDFWKPNKLY